ncbi:MAG: glycosyltransferase [Planctomycetes bacterium]|nr:glycosyltransferase [Planctomycetota bacterium]
MMTYKMKVLNSPTISACMIVKNEEKFLPNCLKSLKNAVDEIIVVDTGSTDNTVNIAKKYGAKVFFHSWNNNYSEARNYAISHTTKDWIFMVDADEELEQDDIPALRQSIRNDKYNGVIIAIYSKVKGGMHKFYYTRVFRRGKAHYEGIIHEQVVVSGEKCPTEIRLYHYGYDLDANTMRKKWLRTTQLLEKQIELNENDSFAWLNLIRNYCTQQLFQDGIKTGKEALKRITPESNIHYFIMILYEIADCYLNIGNTAEAKKICHAALSKLSEMNITPENIDVVYTLACVYLKEGDCDKSIEYFKRYLTLRKWYLENINNCLMTDTLGYDYSAYNGLGFCYGSLGEWEKAVDFLEKAILANPKYSTTYKNLAACYSAMGNNTEAINTLLRSISENIADQEIFIRLGELFIKQQDYKQAVVYYEKYLKLCPEDKNALLKLSWCYEKSGYKDAAQIGYSALRN